MGKVRSAINARLEETSFLAGATASAGVLAVAGGAIALAVTLGGNHADAVPAPVAQAVPHTPAPTLPAAPSPSPSPSHTTAEPKPKPKTVAVPQEAAVYTPAPSPERWGGYQGRHRRPYGGWGHPMGGYPGHFGGGHGGPHFP